MNVSEFIFSLLMNLEFIYFGLIYLLNLYNRLKKRKKRKFLSDLAPCKGRLRGFVERGLRGKIAGTIESPLICPLNNGVFCFKKIKSKIKNQKISIKKGLFLVHFYSFCYCNWKYCCNYYRNNSIYWRNSKFLYNFYHICFKWQSHCNFIFYKSI